MPAIQGSGFRVSGLGFIETLSPELRMVPLIRKRPKTKPEASPKRTKGEALSTKGRNFAGEFRGLGLRGLRV